MSRTKSLVYIAVFAALIAIGAFIRIPFGLVPATLQTAFVMMAGLALGPTKATVSVLIYLALGLAGLPIFTAGGGFDYIFYPTFGYLLGFVFAAWMTGFLFRKFKQKTLFAAVCAGLAGVFAVYLIGLPYLYLIKNIYFNTPIGVNVLFVQCFLIFLPGDLLTMFLSATLVIRLQKIKGLFDNI